MRLKQHKKMKEVTDTPMVGDKAATIIRTKDGKPIYVVELSVLDSNQKLVRQLKLYNKDKQYINTIRNDAIEKLSIAKILSSISDCYDWTDIFGYCITMNYSAEAVYGFNKRGKEID